MPAPTSYTEQSLAEYAHSVVAPVAAKVSWSVENGSYTEIVNEALLGLGVADITLVTTTLQIRQLRALARREAWKALLGHLSSLYEFSMDMQDFNRAQLHDMAEKEYTKACSECAGLKIDSPNYTAQVRHTIHIHDPYAPYDDSLRTWP